MKKLLKSKDFYLSLFYCLLGCLGIALIVKFLLDWAPYEPFWLPENFKPYTFAQHASRWTLLTYFTNITLLLFCFWTILNFIAVAFNIKWLKKFVDNKYVLMFLAVNQLLVLLVFTAGIYFAISLIPKRITPWHIHNIATSIFKHFFLTTAAIAYVFHKKPKGVKFKNCLFMLLYPIIYAVIVEVVCKNCFIFVWYPYPFFGAKHLWSLLFGSFENYNPIYSMLIIFACLLVILGLYVFLCWLLCRLINRPPKEKSNKSRLSKSKKASS